MSTARRIARWAIEWRSESGHWPGPAEYEKQWGSDYDSAGRHVVRVWIQRELSGIVQRRRRGILAPTITVLDAEAVGYPESFIPRSALGGHRGVVHCEHGEMITTETITEAKMQAARARRWCDGCAAGKNVAEWERSRQMHSDKSVS